MNDCTHCLCIAKFLEFSVCKERKTIPENKSTVKACSQHSTKRATVYGGKMHIVHRNTQTSWACN